MNTSLRKKIVLSAVNQWIVQEVLEVVEILLVVMKKFWKQLSQTAVREFVKKTYPDVSDLYILLGESRCTIKHCLLLRQYLREAMWEGFLMWGISHINLLSQITSLSDANFVTVWGDISNPVLSLQSPTKTYKRSLHEDLSKFI